MPDTECNLAVVRCSDLPREDLHELAGKYGVILSWTRPTKSIPGSFWGDDEAGLIGNEIYIRPTTPVHSYLHELCHYICMTPDRRRVLDTNAGGDYDEENAVCYLQILLADTISGYSRGRSMQDMDTWGYSFRLGSAKRWFEDDAGDAIENLKRWGLILDDHSPTGELRTLAPSASASKG